jgi:hypothetical protein
MVGRSQDFDFLKNWINNLAKLQSESGKEIISDSKRIGPGKGQRRNMEKGSKIQKTASAALDYERFRAAKMQQPIAEEDMSPEESQAIDDRVIDQFIIEMVDRDIFEE